MKQLTIAKYLRLSVEDKQTGSTSIAEQRRIIDRYISNYFDKNSINIIEFVDNGHSGTTFERPAMNDMLELISKGKINCVIVKDCSRFGRNHIEAGYLIEMVFPKNNIRFLSIDDSYDSEDSNCNTIHLAFKGIINEQYANDLSKKIKSTKHMKMKTGKLVSKNCVYGYRKNENNELEPDPQTSKNVRTIFSLSCSGHSNSDIARYLYDKKILKPSSYKAKKLQYTDEDYVWDLSQIRRVLTNEQYLGTYIVGKSETQRGGGRSILKPKSEWIIIENHHPAIIEKTDFEKVKAKYPQKNITRTVRQSQKLDGIVICGLCGRVLTRPNNGKNYVCRFAKYIEGFACNDLKITVSALEKRVSNEMKHYISSKIISFDSINDDTLSTLEQQINEQYLIKKGFFEEYLAKELSLESFHEKSLPISEIIEELETQKAQQLKKHKNQAVKTYKKNWRFTRELIAELLENIVVFPDGSIDIKYKKT